MGRKCSTLWDGEPCTSGYKKDTSGTKVITFPSDFEAKWCQNLPNRLDPKDVTVHVGICLKHWPEGFEQKVILGGFKRPVKPPIEFGNTPKTFLVQSQNHADQQIDERRVSSDERAKANCCRRTDYFRTPGSHKFMGRFN